MARELALSGLSVVVVEEGEYVAPEEYGAMTPSNTFRRMAREAALAAAVGLGDTPLIALMAGKCVGGSSVLTGGVCFRVPEDILDVWERDLGLTELGEARGARAALRGRRAAAARGDGAGRDALAERGALRRGARSASASR